MNHVRGPIKKRNLSPIRFLYFMWFEGTGQTKIGYTSNPRDKYDSLAKFAACQVIPVAFVKVDSLDFAKFLEASLHAKFAAHHVSWELFNCPYNPDMLDGTTQIITHLRCSDSVARAWALEALHSSALPLRKMGEAAFAQYLEKVFQNADDSPALHVDGSLPEKPKALRTKAQIKAATKNMLDPVIRMRQVEATRRALKDPAVREKMRAGQILRGWRARPGPGQMRLFE